MDGLGPVDRKITMKPPKITILMPALNAEKFLVGTLASIWAQSFGDFELLIVDDGSIDRTPEILAACRDSRLRVLRNETRRKLAGALNRGLAEARGEFIARMDADDLMRRERLAWQVAYLSRHPEIGCCGGQVRAFGGTSRSILNFPEEPEAIKAFCLFYTPFAHPTVMFRREWFAREYFQFDGSYYPTEDYELWSRVVTRIPCGNLPQVLVDYRIHDKSMTRGEWSDMDIQTKRVQRNILAQLDLAPTEEEIRIHRAASMGQLPATTESLNRTEVWLLKLEAANQKKKMYVPQNLAGILNYVWFRTMMAAVRNLRGSAWRLYRQSRLAAMGDHAVRHRWVVWAAARKAGFSGKSR